MTKLNPKLLHVPKHIRDSMIVSTLSDNLRQQYGRRNARVIKGDSISVLRGEYKGVEGKVEKVNTLRGTLSIEGIQREKIRGGNVKVQIHASNVMITGLMMDDKYRQTKLRREEKNNLKEGKQKRIISKQTFRTKRQTSKRDNKSKEEVKE